MFSPNGKQALKNDNFRFIIVIESGHIFFFPFCTKYLNVRQKCVERERGKNINFTKEN